MRGLVVRGAQVSGLTVQSCIVLRSKYITVVLRVCVSFAGLDLDLDLPLATLDLKLKPKLELELARFPVAYPSHLANKIGVCSLSQTCRLFVAPLPRSRQKDRQTERDGHTERDGQTDRDGTTRLPDSLTACT